MTRPQLPDHYSTGTLTLEGSTLRYAPWDRAVEIDGDDLPYVQGILATPIMDEDDVAAAFQWVEHWRGRSVLNVWLRRAAS